MFELTEPTTDPTLVVPGSSELARLVREFDWAASPLGDPAGWSIALRSAVAMCLSSRFPMLVVWGPELVKIYNDGYRAILGSEKHPRALGAPAREIWPEIWDVIGPKFEQVMTTGVSTFDEHQLLVLERNGFAEECYFIYSYSSLFDDDGSIGGVLDVVVETTTEVVTSRRLAALSELHHDLAEAEQVTDMCSRAASSLTGHRGDITALEIHLVVNDELRLVATNRRDESPIPSSIVEEVAATGRTAVLGMARPGFPAHHHVMRIGDADSVTGVVAMSLDPRRPFDTAMDDFVRLVTLAIDSALRTTYRRSVEMGVYRHISDTLQAAMLAPASNLASVAARYVPAVGNLAVGGDWYDIMELPDGRRALVVGDCVGHGLDAATAMSQLRSAVRAMLLEGRGPAAMLDGLDSFASSVEGADCATVAVTVIDRQAQTVEYARAGHPPPLLVGRCGARWLDEAGGPPLGVGSGQARRSATAELREHDLVVLYSDGLVERRGESLDVGLARLARTAQELHGTGNVQYVADRLMQALMPEQDADDIVLVVKHLPGPD